MLGKMDFPSYYVDMKHPDDEKLQDKPITPHFVYLVRSDRHTRLLLRISVKVPQGFVPLTFVCDSGAPGDMYLRESAFELLLKAARVRETVPLCSMIIHGEHVSVGESPPPHEKANVIGLKMMQRWKFQLLGSEHDPPAKLGVDLEYL